MICLRCDNEEFEVKQDAVTEQEFRGELLKVRTTAMVCTKCGWAAVNIDQLDELRRRTADTYREKHGLLTSKEIKAYRELLKMSQVEFAAFLGVGVASVKRWETWLVQERGNDQLIRVKCKQALDERLGQPAEAAVWICAAAIHGTLHVSNWVKIQPTTPKVIMSSRWDQPGAGGIAAQTEPQLALPEPTQSATSGLSPPGRETFAFSLSGPCKREQGVEKENADAMRLRNSRITAFWKTCIQD
jgi:putative zinc finger/helix-turn-helix YgiT family protein